MQSGTLFHTMSPLCAQRHAIADGHKGQRHALIAQQAVVELADGRRRIVILPSCSVSTTQYRVKGVFHEVFDNAQA